MSCFRIDLSAYNGIDEAKLDAWAKRFFKTYIWKKPVLFGEVVESDYKRQQLQTLVNHNLKNWKAEKTLRYNKQWVTRITPWLFAAEFPAGYQAFAARKIERLAAILSLQNVGFSPWNRKRNPDWPRRRVKKLEPNGVLSCLVKWIRIRCSTAMAIQ